MSYPGQTAARHKMFRTAPRMWYNASREEACNFAFYPDDTLEFLVRNKLMDSREWFHEHHGEYERLVVEPLAELVSALTPALAEIDPNIVCVPKVGKSISRIWRDTRAGPGCPYTGTSCG